MKENARVLLESFGINGYSKRLYAVEYNDGSTVFEVQIDDQVKQYAKLEHAYMRYKGRPIFWDRLCEIATTTLNKIWEDDDYWQREEVMEDLDLTEEEAEYFGISLETEEGEDEEED